MDHSVDWTQIGRDRLLELLGLSTEFVSAEGDHLHWIDRRGESRTAVDFVGGAGAVLLGHNHPKVVSAARDHFDSRRPTLVQGARRVLAQKLKEVLAQQLKAVTGRDYEIMLFSTGTEAVEAALKHARLELLNRQAHAHRATVSAVRKLRRAVRAGRCRLSPEFLRDAARLLGQPNVVDLESLATALTAHNAPAFEHPGLLIAIEGGFHGKTMGSLAVTWNPDARRPFVRGEQQVRFLRPGIDSLDELVREADFDLFELEHDPPRLIPTRFSTLAAVIGEPIRGEGGVFELEESLAEQLRTLCEQRPDTPVIIDEIQTGLGRTGHFLDSVSRNLPCPYLTLGKALGGGIAKLSAVAIDRRRYRPEYSLLHTSTFAEDEYSCAVGLATLEVVASDAIAERCSRLGVALRDALAEVAATWPGHVAEVRGRGLMQGLEFREQSANASAVVRALDAEQLLSVVIASYLLHRHDLRIMPTVGRRRVLRFEPSAYLEPSAIDRMRDALSDVCALLDSGDACRLLAHLVDNDNDGAPEQVRVEVVAPPKPPVRPLASVGAPSSRVAFIGHLVDGQSLSDWDASLARLRPSALGRLLDTLEGVLPPRVIATRSVRSMLGPTVELSLIGIALTARAFERDLRQNQGRVVRPQVFAAYELARQLGCSLVGFGGYTSIATMNCAEFVEEGPAVTTGNALTVGVGFDALQRTSAELGIDFGKSVAAVCGAGGNIGHINAMLLAQHCGELRLVGRPGSMRRLAHGAKEIAAELARCVRSGEPGGALLERFRRAYRQIGEPSPDDPQLLKRVEEVLRRPLVEVSEDLNALRTVQVIVAASNSATPIIGASHLASDRRVVICDVAVPTDVRPEVFDRANVRVIAGGVVSVPNDPSFRLPGIALPAGEIYACAAETLVLGLSGIARDFSRGAIASCQVREIMALAELHGFRLASEKSTSAFRAA